MDKNDKRKCHYIKITYVMPLVAQTISVFFALSPTRLIVLHLIVFYLPVSPYISHFVFPTYLPLVLAPFPVFVLLYQPVPHPNFSSSGARPFHLSDIISSVHSSFLRFTWCSTYAGSLSSTTPPSPPASRFSFHFSPIFYISLSESVILDTLSANHPQSIAPFTPT